MMRKMVFIDNEEAKEEFKKFGYTHYNAVLPNWEETDEEWIATRSQFRTYGFTHSWFQQIMDLPNEKGPLSVYCFGSWDGSGIAMSIDYWGKKIRWFKFAKCVHEYRQPTHAECVEHHSFPGNCYHVYICDKCGQWYTVDSSD